MKSLLLKKVTQYYKIIWKVINNGEEKLIVKERESLKGKIKL